MLLAVDLATQDRTLKGAAAEVEGEADNASN
jgi:hypothetical protein